MALLAKLPCLLAIGSAKEANGIVTKRRNGPVKTEGTVLGAQLQVIPAKRAPHTPSLRLRLGRQLALAGHGPRGQRFPALDFNNTGNLFEASETLLGIFFL